MCRGNSLFFIMLLSMFTERVVKHIVLFPGISDKNLVFYNFHRNIDSPSKSSLKCFRNPKVFQGLRPWTPLGGLRTRKTSAWSKLFLKPLALLSLFSFYLIAYENIMNIISGNERKGRAGKSRVGSKSAGRPK